MASHAQTQKYPGFKNIVAPASTNPVLSADFKTVDFTVNGGEILTYDTLVGNFIVGESITGSGPGTGIVAYDNQTDTLYIESVTGGFSNGDTITGDESGATADLTADASSPNFTIEAFISNQELPPDSTLPASSSNQYSEVSYMDLANGNSYDTQAALYNPSGNTEDKTFEAQLDGARWFFVRLVDYTSGALVLLEISLFSNFT